MAELLEQKGKGTSISLVSHRLLSCRSSRCRKEHIAQSQGDVKVQAFGTEVEKELDIVLLRISSKAGAGRQDMTS